MNARWRRPAGAVVGTLTADLLMAASIRFGAFLYPQPVPVDWAEQVAFHLPDQPTPLAPKLLLVAGWFVSAFAGAWLAARVARSAWIAVFPSAVLWLFAFGSIAMTPTPVWLGWTALLLPPIAGWLGARAAGQGSGGLARAA